MPIYEYQCEACGHLHEALQKVSDAPLVDCPACGKAALRKKISAAAFRLKGGGWYETDFKNSNRKNLAGDDAGKKDGTPDAPKDAVPKSGDSGGGDTAAAPKTDSKPAAGGSGTGAA